MNLIDLSLFQLIIEVIIFLILVVIGKFAVKKIRDSDNKFFNPLEYFPSEEVHTIRQVYYLILMALCFVGVLYSLTFNGTDILYLVVFDIILSWYVAITIDDTSKWHKLLVFLLIPFGSLTYVLYGISMVSILDYVHLPVFIYLVKYYYDNFRMYTKNNSLGITIVLLFLIIFVSFFFTQFVEMVNPLDALVMVSNAFTSNGYAVLGSTIPGKINSLFLVWLGYIMSGVGTATLTAAILSKYFNKKFEELEELIKKNNED